MFRHKKAGVPQRDSQHLRRKGTGDILGRDPSSGLSIQNIFFAYSFSLEMLPDAELFQFFCIYLGFKPASAVPSHSLCCVWKGEVSHRGKPKGWFVEQSLVFCLDDNNYLTNSAASERKRDFPFYKKWDQFCSLLFTTRAVKISTRNQLRPHCKTARLVNDDGTWLLHALPNACTALPSACKHPSPTSDVTKPPLKERGE